MRVENNQVIEFTVSDGCITCPFSRENDCAAADKAVNSTHDYTFPSKCPLFTHEISVKIGHKAGKV